MIYKKYVVKQQDIKDCGACCLLSIIKYYDGFVPLEQIKLDTCISKNGISAFNLLDAARGYGFECFGERLSFVELINNDIITPIIAYLEYESGLKHYVVIYDIKPKYILIMDPARGLIKEKYDDFKRIYKDVTLNFSPKTKVVKYNKPNKLKNIFFNMFKTNKRIINKIFICQIIFMISAVVSSFYLKVVIGNVNSYLKISLIFILISIIKVVSEYLKNYYNIYLNKNIDINITYPFIYHIFNLPLNAISSRSKGEIIRRVEELDNIKEAFNKLLFGLAFDLLLAIISCFILFLISRILTIYLLILIIVYIVVNLFFVNNVNKYIDSLIRSQSDYTTIISNLLDGFSSLKNYGVFYKKRLDVNISKYIKDNFNFNKFLNFYNFFNNFIFEIMSFFLTFFALSLIINNKLELVTFITYQAVFMYLYNPIKDIMSIIPEVKYYISSFNKINDFISLKEEDNLISSDFINGDIVFKNISFSYNNYDYPLNNYNLVIKENSKVLVYGKSGIGKSTIFKLLFRLYDLTKGNIFINDININDYPIKTIRDNICFISQDERLYNDTLLNNIKLNSNISLIDSSEVLKICHINDIIEKKKFRLNTTICDDGTNLSGGEKARIFIARALLKNSEIIIFDETFSSINIDLATRIINDINMIYKNKTIIYISHVKYNCIFDNIIEVGNETIHV